MADDRLKETARLIMENKASEQAALIQQIEELKLRRKAVILAHNYQIDEVQEIADFVGDSFELSRKAAGTDSEVIIFCGVHFMAESAAILSPDKIVVLPERLAGCPLADTITVERLERKKAEHPSVPVVCYINSSAAVKAASDICCTSANAAKVVEAVDHDVVLFVPDRNLAYWVQQQTSKKIIPWQGACVTHHRVTPEEVQRAREKHPDAAVAVHPECRPETAELADFVGSTSAILKFCRETSHEKVIIGTEMGILHRLKKENPGREFYILSPKLVCPNMKYTNLKKVARALETLEPRITVPEETRAAALKALERMLAVH